MVANYKTDASDEAGETQINSQRDELWYCPVCKTSVQWEHVTFDERHDPRAGGCGHHVREQSEPVYVIPPLSWERCEELPTWLVAKTPFGEYIVRRFQGNWLWVYRASLDPWNQTAEKQCASLEEGKALAQAHWENELKRALVEVSSS